MEDGGNKNNLIDGGNKNNLIDGGGSGGSSGSGSPTNSRWNPTKEHINMLEGLYKQGIRTPSAEQIQQITAKLRVYGHIEGKNVFYWFQNHKARQRQKQKQENIHYVNRFLHKASPPVFLPPPPPSPFNNVQYCSPFFMPPQANVGYYHQNPKVALPAAGVVKRRPMVEKKQQEMMSGSFAAGYLPAQNRLDSMQVQRGDFNNVVHQNSSINNTMTTTSTPTRTRTSSYETLALFPQHPTGILDSAGNSMSTSSDDNSANLSSSESTCIDHETTTSAGSAADLLQNQPFFDFFGAGHG